MKIYGVDFTSAPKRKKAITCAEGRLDGRQLHIDTVRRLESFEAFDAFLNHTGPWLAGIDFPFGQPLKLITNLKWPSAWAGYVSHVDAPGLPAFVDLLARYRRRRRKGDKQHLRLVDEKAKSRSPMMLYGVPVGRMFFRGAPRLLKSGVSIEPCHPTQTNRVVVEAYPALVAGKWTASKPHYKHDKLAKQSLAHRAARQTILDGICSTHLLEFYGLTLELSADLAKDCLDDASGDTLDAVLCAIQAAWAHRQRHKGYGIPADCDRLEGWIVDPELLAP